MLGRRRRRRANIDPTLVQCLVFAGMHVPVIQQAALAAVKQHLQVMQSSAVGNIELDDAG